ncbi:hypothetical protein KGM48_01295 [Patescibacteria group bacterium]|nr:hypothetical protein [Patescibacteria group bacterium]
MASPEQLGRRTNGPEKIETTLPASPSDDLTGTDRDDFIAALKKLRSRALEDGDYQKMFAIENRLWGKGGIDEKALLGKEGIDEGSATSQPHEEVKKDPGEFPASVEADVDPFAEDEDMSGTPDGTREWSARWRGKLRSIVEGSKELVGGLSERGARLSEYLKNRSVEIDAKAEMSKLERGFRWMGERYDKLGWKSKVAIGASLGIGAGAASAISLPVALALTGGIAAQRVFGLASAFTKLEKRYQDKESGGFFAKKERAMGKAMVHAAFMTGVMLAVAEGAKEVTEYAREHQLTERLLEWLRHSHSLDHSAPPTAAHPAPVLEMNAPASGNLMPEVSVEASSRGYEGMTRHLWERLQEQHLDPSKFPEGSDIRRLLEADAHSIGKVAHQIASDPSHGFFKPDGTSVVVPESAHMTIGADGQLHMSDSALPGGFVHAPENAAVTEGSQHHYEWENEPVRTTVEPVPSDTPAYDVPQNTTPESAPFQTPDSLIETPTPDAHIYSGLDGGRPIAFGGTPEKLHAAITEYLKQNPGKGIVGNDDAGAHRVLWHLVDDKLTSSAPLREKIFGLFSRTLPPFGPDDFRNIIT